MPKRLIFAALIAMGAYMSYTARSIDHDPGVLVETIPNQKKMADVTPFAHKGFRVTPLAEFNLDARVLGTERYRLDRGADLSPIDLALGWGPMSDSAVISQLSISQSGRFYHWSAATLPIPAQAISSHSANMHMVPADSRIEKKLKRLREGDVVNLTGYLIRVDADDGWHWVSSLTREDSGNGACELVWVKELSVRTSTL